MRSRMRFSVMQTAVMLVWLLGVAPSPGAAQDAPAVQPLFPVRLEHPFPEPQKTFEAVKDLILEQYYNEEISPEALYWAAIEGMLRYISPPENPDLGQIWTAEQYEKVLLARQGNQISIGIKSTFNPEDGRLTVIEVLPHSPAASILQPLDQILRIDAVALKGKSLAELNALLDGEEGTPVTLTVNRDVQVFDITLKRSKFEVESLVVSPLSESVALVEIKSFTSDIAQKLKAELTRLQQEGIDKLMIDLRGNIGGLLGEALRTVELFLPEKHILLRTFQRPAGLQNYVSANARPFFFDLAVLVDHKTASSAEILASALQDHKKALIVGTRTYGKGVFEKTFTLANDYRVKFITGSMYSPKGVSWESRGITPDFLVDQDDKTLAALLRLDPRQRLRQDLAMMTAYKLLMR